MLVENNHDVTSSALRQKTNELSMTVSLVMSILIHFVLPISVAIGLFILALLGINLLLFNPPQPKVNDIEFKLVQAPEQEPLVKTKNRAEKNTRAGGKNDPKKPESEPQPKAAPKPAQKPQQAAKPKPKQKPKQKAQQKKSVQKQKKPQPKPKPKSNPPMPIPVAEAPKPSAPRNIMSPPVSMPFTKKPTGPKIASVGPITDNSPSETSNNNSADSSPAPISMNSPAIASRSSSSASSSAMPSSGSNRYGSGNPGNPSAGNPSAAPGINARKDPDFGPYMADLQRRIKRNWQPPKQSNSKRSVLLFTVAKDGRLLNLRIVRSAGDANIDRAAISAVQLTAPFRPLPRDFSGSSIDIQFTFDYNVFGVGGRMY